MIIQCSKCQKKYKIDPEKVTDKGVKVTCQSCGNVMLVRKKAEEEQKDAVPCSVCGQPASLNLDTDHPMCTRCKDIEHERTARFADVSGEKDATPPPGQARELDLSAKGDVSFENISGGDFAPAAYSTDVLPGEGKDYKPPLEREGPGAGNGTADFESISAPSTAEQFFPTPPREEAQKAKPASAKPLAVQASKTSAPPKAQTPSAGERKQPSEPAAAPAQKPATKEPTSPPMSAPKPITSRPVSMSVGVKDATPPALRPIPKPETPFDKTPAPAQAPDKKKTDMKAEAPVAAPIEGLPGVEKADAQAGATLEEKPPGASPATEPSRRTAFVPLILSVLLLAAMALYFFVKFVNLGG